MALLIHRTREPKILGTGGGMVVAWEERKS